MTFFQLEDLLSQEGYENKHQPDINDPCMWFDPSEHARYHYYGASDPAEEEEAEREDPPTV